MEILAWLLDFLFGLPWGIIAIVAIVIFAIAQGRVNRLHHARSSKDDFNTFFAYASAVAIALSILIPVLHAAFKAH